jgi:DNA-binding CsgD family transcriptional regulator
MTGDCEARLSELRNLLTGNRPGTVPTLSLVTPRLRELLDAERALAYRVDEHEASRSLAFVYTAGFGPNRIVEETLQRYVKRAPKRFASYVPGALLEDERNTVDAASFEERGEAPIYRELAGGAGLAGMHRLRVLLCDGDRLLAWVGVFRGTPFGKEERETLESLVPLLRDRLLLEEMLDESWLNQEALRASLDALEGPAFLFTRAGEVRDSNAAGRVARSRDPEGVKRDLLRSLEGEADAPYHVTEIARRGVVSHFLAVRRGGADAAARRREIAARRWGLTPRQAEVVALIAKGLTNRAIADRIGCTEGTVGLHVSAILQKAAAEGRAELTARFWTLE